MALRHKSPHGVSELLPGFSDITQIGAGDIATVYSARESETGRTVALKLLNVRQISPDALEALLRETSVLETLSAHPNIVTLYRTDVTPDGRPVLVMDLWRGSVADRSHWAGGREPGRAVSLAVKIAGALETAHRAGIVHGSITPPDLRMTHYGDVALADLGVARLRFPSGTAGAATSATSATLHAAPEMVEGTTATTATDVYGLASTLYAMLAGHAAFRSFAGETAAAVFVRILRDPVPPLSVAGVPMALSDLLVEGMAKNPLKRPLSALEFADRLKSIEDTQSWSPTSYFVMGDAASRFFEPVPWNEIDAAGLPDPGAAAPSLARTEDSPASAPSTGSDREVPVASLPWFSAKATRRSTPQESPRFGGGWVPPVAPVAAGLPVPIVRHAPASRVAPTPKTERRIIVPTPRGNVAPGSVVAPSPTPTTRPNTGRRVATADPLLTLLSRAGPPTGDPTSPVVNPRFFDPEPLALQDRAEKRPAPAGVTAAMPPVDFAGPTPDNGFFGYPSPDLVEETILRSGPPDTAREPSPEDPEPARIARPITPMRRRRRDS
jgi:serine/threonine protein kinase